VLDAQHVERLGDDLGAREGGRRDDQDRDVREAASLGGDHAAKVHLIADDEIRSPCGAQVQQVRRSVVCQPAGIKVAHDPVLPVHVERKQRDDGRRCACGAGRIGKHGEPLRFGDGGARVMASERDDVSGSLDGAGDWHERIRMTAPPSEREQNAHH